MQKLLMIGVCVLGTLATPASSQEWPARTLTMINPFAAGGPNDVPAGCLPAAWVKSSGNR
jgi:tripartite-type tricarboxylate transporter receptor subunit TctC